MRVIILAVATVLTAFATVRCAADESVVNARSTLAQDSRYELVGSPLLAKLTMRFDRFSGDVDLFVRGKNGGYTWRTMDREPQDGNVRLAGKVNYQLYLSGILAQETILMNVNTGVSWYIAVDPKEGEFWAAMH